MTSPERRVQAWKWLVLLEMGRLVARLRSATQALHIAGKQGHSRVSNTKGISVLSASASDDVWSTKGGDVVTHLANSLAKSQLLGDTVLVYPRDIFLGGGGNGIYGGEPSMYLTHLGYICKRKDVDRNPIFWTPLGPLDF